MNCRFVTFYGNIFTFNAWAPSAIVMGLIWDGRMRRRDMVFVMSLLFGAALFQCVAIGLVVGVLFTLRKTLLMDNMKNLKTWCGIVLCVVYLLFFLGQVGHGTASGLHFLFSDDWPLSPSVKYIRYVVIVVSLLLPPYIILPVRFRKNVIFKAMLLIAIVIPMLWMGRANNELCFKSGQIFFMLFAYLLFLTWQTAGKWRKVFIVVFTAVSSIHLFGDLYRRNILQYSWSDETIEKNVIKCDKNQINNPDGYYYYNFYGEVALPVLQYDKPGESLVK